ncbi:MAG: hypothetical protein ACE5R6_20665 [Candidatus Heimdallarchaeota archaeon]
MKRVVARGIGHFRILIDHSIRPYEPSPDHLLERMIIPLCQDFARILKKGTKNDTWMLFQGFEKECARVSKFRELEKD